MMSRSSRSKWWLLLLVPLCIVIVVFGSIIRARLRGLSTSDGVVIGCALLGGYAVIVVGSLLWERFGNSEGEGSLPEPKSGISRWTQR